jgi:AcrR family transcriptional regulator
MSTRTEATTKPRIGRRAQNRTRTLDTVRQVALRQLSELGAGAISLNAIAREMGMTGPALFRYVPNRDALITMLVIEAFTDLGDALWMSVEASAGQSPEVRLRAQCAVYRTWALANPQRYLLIFGTPVPGYHAPAEETDPAAARLLTSAIALLDEVVPSRWQPATDGPDRDLETWALDAGLPTMPASLIRHALYGWTRLHGVLSLELAGHFGKALPDAAALYASEVDALVDALHDALA